MLRRAPELRIALDSTGAVTIHAGARRVARCGPHGLAVLDAFGEPAAFGEALAGLTARARGRHDWMDLARTVEYLVAAGVLEEAGAARPSLAPRSRGFDAARIHVAMLDDETRTAAYLTAIREVVRPGDVVVDLGTGTGVLAVAAAQAGARHVYAIEAGGIADYAQAVFDANGLGDRITLVRGWSTRVTLPERADVLVSETIGSEPLEEGVERAIADARERLLVAEPRFVPRAVRTLALPVTIPPAALSRWTFTAENTQAWSGRYGMDLRPLSATPRVAAVQYRARHAVTRRWTALAEPVRLAELDLTTGGAAALPDARTTASRAGVLNGILLYFELEVGPGSRITTHPATAPEHCHWRNPVWLLPAETRVRPGDVIAMRYASPLTGPEVTVESGGAISR